MSERKFPPTQRASAGENERTSGLELRHLRGLVALVDTGSMTAAAQALGISQSTVSETVAALERALGTPVVARRRGGRETTLTAAGRALLPHARRVLSLLDDAQAAVTAAAREARARVEVIANESISTYLLPPALAGLRTRWPNTRFIVSVGTCSAVRDGLAHGRFDVGALLEVASGAGPAARAGDASPAGGALLLFCSPAHPLARGRSAPVPRASLARYRVYSSDASGDFHALLTAYFEAGGLPGPRLEPAGSIEAVKRSVAASPLALGVLPDYALAEELAERAVAALPVRPSLPRMRLEALLCSTKPAHPAAAELVEALRATLARPGLAPEPRPREHRAK